MDFSDVSQILTEYVHDVIDHSFVVYEKDTEAISALNMMNDNIEL